jgi:hypothetical protein
MFLVLFCVAVGVAVLWPDTSPGRALRRWMIELPAERLTPGVLLVGLLALIAFATVIGLGRTDAIFLLAQGVPEGIGWFVTFDIATYLDVIALAWLLAATVRLRTVYAAVKTLAACAWRLPSSRGARPRPGPARARRGSRPGGRLPTPSKDEDRPPAWAFA